MIEDEQLLNLLNPVIAMRQQWFAYADDIPVIFDVQASAQRIDYLLSATLAAYEYVIQKSENDSDLNLTEWHSRYESRDSALVSFYGPDMHCWKLNELIQKLCFESKRTAQKIRPTLLRELMLKQLEMCRMMVTYSIEGDIWGRSFGAAFSLVELIDLYEDSDEYPDEDSQEHFYEDLSMKLTDMAQLCIRLWDEKENDFSFPRFDDIEDGKQTMLTLLGVGVDICLRSEGLWPLSSTSGPKLIALYEFDSSDIATIQFATSIGVFYRERGFWWNFGLEAEEFFDDFEMRFVKPEFVEHFDKGRRIAAADLTPYAFTYEELFPNG